MNRLLLLLFLISCRSGEKPAEPEKEKHFDQLEMTYNGGWTSRVVFKLKSDHRFYLPHSMDSTGIGTVPDSVYRRIDSLTTVILNDTTIRNDDSVMCNDCSVIALDIAIEKDTVKILQSGRFHSSIRELVTTIESFLSTRPYGKVEGVQDFPSYRRVFSPPPPIDPK